MSKDKTYRLEKNCSLVSWVSYFHHGVLRQKIDEDEEKFLAIEKCEHSVLNGLFSVRNEMK